MNYDYLFTYLYIYIIAFVFYYLCPIYYTYSNLMDFEENKNLIWKNVLGIFYELNDVFLNNLTKDLQLFLYLTKCL